MPKVQTVMIDFEVVETALKAKRWKYATLCHAMGKNTGWVTDIKTGRMNPSVDATADMCITLSIDPYKLCIFKEEADLVKQKMPTTEPVDDGQLTDDEAEMLALFNALPPDKQAKALGYLQGLSNK